MRCYFIILIRLLHCSTQWTNGWKTLSSVFDSWQDRDMSWWYPPWFDALWNVARLSFQVLSWRCQNFRITKQPISLIWHVVSLSTSLSWSLKCFPLFYSLRDMGFCLYFQWYFICSLITYRQQLQWPYVPLILPILCSGKISEMKWISI
jgi:hypothetical protein